MLLQLAAVALSKYSTRAVHTIQAVASIMLSSLFQLTQSHHRVFALHYICAVRRSDMERCCRCMGTGVKRDPIGFRLPHEGSDSDEA